MASLAIPRKKHCLLQALCSIEAVHSQDAPSYSLQVVIESTQMGMGLQVDILVVNCSVFNPTPSLSAAVVNQFRLKPTVITYNLSGMGCSAGLLSIALVRELLQVKPANNLRAPSV